MSSSLISCLNHRIAQSLTSGFLCRHYVAFIRKTLPGTSNNEEAWILFNDEKVVKAEGDVDEMKKFAYVYLFERV